MDTDMNGRNERAGFSDNMRRLINAAQAKQIKDNNSQIDSQGVRGTTSSRQNLTPEQESARQAAMEKLRKDMESRKAAREEAGANQISKESLHRGFKDFTSQEDIRSAKELTDFLNKDGQHVQDVREDDYYDEVWQAKVKAFREALREVETGRGFRDGMGQRSKGSEMGKRLDTIAELSRPAVDWHGMLRRMFDSPTEYLDRVKYKNRQIFNAVEYDKSPGDRQKEIWEEEETELEHMFIMIDNTGSFIDAVAPLLSEIFTICTTKSVKKVSFTYFTCEPVRPDKVRSWTMGEDFESVKRKLKRREDDLTGYTDVFLCAQSLQDLPKECFDPKKTKLLILSDFETDAASKDFMDKYPYIKNAYYVIVNNTKLSSDKVATELNEWGVSRSHCFPFSFRQLLDNIRSNENWDAVQKTLS